jgi:hypothetical protein
MGEHWNDAGLLAYAPPLPDLYVPTQAGPMKGSLRCERIIAGARRNVACSTFRRLRQINVLFLNRETLTRPRRTSRAPELMKLLVLQTCAVRPNRNASVTRLQVPFDGLRISQPGMLQRMTLRGVHPCCVSSHTCPQPDQYGQAAWTFPKAELHSGNSPVADISAFLPKKKFDLQQVDIEHRRTATRARGGSWSIPTAALILVS